MRRKKIKKPLKRKAREKKAEKPKDRINSYTCQKCQRSIFTIDVDPGVTPFMVVCRYDGCSGRMVSHMYRVEAIPPGAKIYEWYKEPVKKGMDLALIEHIKNGGLSLRPREDHNNE